MSSEFFDNNIEFWLNLTSQVEEANAKAEADRSDNHFKVITWLSKNKAENTKTVSEVTVAKTDIF
jgi:plasmid maintenance system antidote protein VapI